MNLSDFKNGRFGKRGRTIGLADSPLIDAGGMSDLASLVSQEREKSTGKHFRVVLPAESLNEISRLLVVCSETATVIRESFLFDCGTSIGLVLELTPDEIEPGVPLQDETNTNRLAISYLTIDHLHQEMEELEQANNKLYELLGLAKPNERSPQSAFASVRNLSAELNQLRTQNENMMKAAQGQKLREQSNHEASDRFTARIEQQDEQLRSLSARNITQYEQIAALQEQLILREAKILDLQEKLQSPSWMDRILRFLGRRS